MDFNSCGSDTTSIGSSFLKRLGFILIWLSIFNLYNEKIIPHIQIHDELDISVIDDNHAKKIVEIMEGAVTLAIPNKVDYESGETWGDIYD